MNLNIFDVCHVADPTVPQTCSGSIGQLCWAPDVAIPQRNSIFAISWTYLSKVLVQFSYTSKLIYSPVTVQMWGTARHDEQLTRSC